MNNLDGLDVMLNQFSLERSRILADVMRIKHYIKNFNHDVNMDLAEGVLRVIEEYNVNPASVSDKPNEYDLILNFNIVSVVYEKEAEFIINNYIKRLELFLDSQLNLNKTTNQKYAIKINRAEENVEINIQYFFV